MVPRILIPASRWGTHQANARRRVAASCIMLFLLAFAIPLTAQPNLNFKRVTVNRPDIELYFSVGCNGNPAYDMQKQHFRIFENGAEIQNFTLWCPDPTTRCAISVALVFDASGSMAGAGNAGAKLSGHAFVDLMDGMVDEAAILWFNDRVTIYQQMTTIKPMLHSAVDALPASGVTAVWDGIYAGIVELVNNGVNPCRSVIAMTDGGDNSSARSVAEIIALANRHQIKVFTIGIGSGINATELEQIALLTGGRYYQTPNPGQLAVIVTEIFQIIAINGGNECRITFQRTCADGDMRTIELQLTNYCGGTDTKTKTYRAPLDSTTFTDLRMKIGDTWAVRGSDLAVPLNLVTPLASEMLYPFSFSIAYDTSHVQWKGVYAPPGSLLDGVPITAAPVSGGVRISVNNRKLINGSGKLLELLFKSSSPPQETCRGIHANNVLIEQGCRMPKIDSGRVCLVVPEGDAWYCSVIVPEIRVDTANERYDPMPFEVFTKLSNIGAFPVDSVSAEISFDPELSFAAPDGPGSEKKALTPAVIAPGTIGGVSWRLQHPNSISPKDYYISVRMFTPSDTSTCQEILHIPAMVLEPFSFSIAADGPLSLCDGDSVTLDAGAGNTRLFWNTGDTSQTITVKTAGIYHCTVLRSDGRVGTSDTVRVVIYPTPSTRIFVFGSIPMCEGDSVTLDAGSGFSSYLWNTGATTGTISVRWPGAYWVEVRSANNCVGYSDTVTVTSKQGPAKPVVTRVGDVLMSPPAVTYTWLRNGIELVGEVNQFLVVTQTGRYQVRVTDENGCSALSDEIDVTVLDAGGVPAVVRRFDVYPDPTHGEVTVDLRLERTEAIRILVLNALGQELARYESGVPVRDFSRRVELGAAPGAYFLHITAGSDSWVRRVVRVQ
ncbi:MAG: VWA domain-containing protein [Bacteroidetes bacterium]|nr:VWA domain-containing protein [Bacteroidota bacterium]